MKENHKKCANKECGKEFKAYTTLDKYCSPTCYLLCSKPKSKKYPKPIPKVSQKMKVELLQYSADRTVFLAGKTCFIDGCNKKANTVEHTRGRKGFADEWARDNKVSLLLDKRFWQPCCIEHNLELENNPELSKQYQLSKIHGGTKL